MVEVRIFLTQTRNYQNPIDQQITGSNRSDQGLTDLVKHKLTILIILFIPYRNHLKSIKQNYNIIITLYSSSHFFISFTSYIYNIV